MPVSFGRISSSCVLFSCEPVKGDSSEAAGLQEGSPGPWVEQYSLELAVTECSLWAVRA
jgi:hypothetical protein